MVKNALADRDLSASLVGAETAIPPAIAAANAKARALAAEARGLCADLRSARDPVAPLAPPGTSQTLRARR